MAEVKGKKKNTKTEIQVTKPTDDELILGVKEEVKKVKVVDYLAKEAKYNVKVFANGRTIQANGIEIGTFLGMDYIARNQLKEGVKKVLIKDDREKNLYEIEVIG